MSEDYSLHLSRVYSSSRVTRLYEENEVGLPRPSSMTMGYSILYPYRVRGVEGKFPGDVPEAFSKGVRD